MIWLLACTGGDIWCPEGFEAAEDGNCYPGSDDDPPYELEALPVEPLDGARLARRLSLDLRGVLPSEDDLDRAEADPSALDDMRVNWMEDELFEERLVEMLGLRWRTLVDDVTVQVGEVGLDQDQEYAYERSVGEEPLRLMARIAVKDRRWSEVLTADFTMSNEVLAGIWPLDYPAGDTGWQKSRYTDGRPAAGVLATNGLWWRYETDESNANRRRAAAITRLVLCHDYLQRPISFSELDLGQDDDVDDLVRTEPSCATCHSTLDPLAATLFGFWWFEDHHVDERSTYHAARERLGEDTLGVAPALGGSPLSGLEDLGASLAEDPRVARCAVEGFAEALWRRPVSVEDFDAIALHTRAFEASDQQVRALFVSLTEDARYTAGAVQEDAPEDLVEARRLLLPEQLARAVEHQTGFSWTSGGTDLMRNDEDGFRVLAGGVDGRQAVVPSKSPGVTAALVVERLAQAAASHAVANPDEAPLVDGIDLDGEPGAGIEAMHWRLLARRGESAELAELEALWLEIEAEDGRDEAWAAVISVLLRDAEFLSL